MPTVIVPATLSTGQPVRVRAAVSLNTNPATRPATQQERAAAWLTGRASRLLTDGYRFARLDSERLTCTKPDGTVYTLDIVHGRCSCPATVRCSHMVVGEAICRLCATHPVRPEPHWFTGNCPECGKPAWSYPAALGGSGSGRTARLSVCLHGCEAKQVIWGEVK